METIAKKIVKVEAEIKFYTDLSKEHPDRMLTPLIRNLKVRKNTLEELI